VGEEHWRSVLVTGGEILGTIRIKDINMTILNVEINLKQVEIKCKKQMNYEIYDYNGR
jgi:formiminotetrahydrofolate cyclodeaminase